MCIAGDNRRAVVGGIDGRVYVYDMHTGCLARTITTPHNMEVVQVKITNRDDYLITAGIVFLSKLDKKAQHETKSLCNHGLK